MPGFTLYALAKLIGKVHLVQHADSRTKKLLEQGLGRVSKKLVEEVREFIKAVEGEDRELIVIKAADFVYCFIVTLKLRGIPLPLIMSELYRRTREPRDSEKAIP